MKTEPIGASPHNTGDSERAARLFKIGTVIAPTIRMKFSWVKIDDLYLFIRQLNQII